MYLTEYGHLIVDEIGASLKKKKKRILIIQKEKKAEIPVKSVRDVIITGKVSISSELINFLCQSGISLLLTSTTLRPIARLVSVKLGGTAENRIEQYESIKDERSSEIGKTIITGKMRNQISNLRYYSKSRRMNEPESRILYQLSEKIKEKLEGLKVEEFHEIEEARRRILAYEGEAANIYWEGMKLVFSKWNFRGRERKSSDPVNICLNVCYNLLSGQIWKYTLTFGLDPFLGYIHVERPGRLSLIYDLMEPYRPMVDRFVASFLRRMRREDFSNRTKSRTIGVLRREFYEDFLSHKIDYKGRKLSLESTMFYYVQSLVSYLKGRGKLVTPYFAW